MRISPWEVHVQDPDFLHQMLSTKAHLDKDPWYYRFVGFPRSGAATSCALLHHARRIPLVTLFSKSAVRRSISIVEDGVKDLLSGLEEHRGSHSEVELSNPLRCLVFDVACGFAMPRSLGKLRKPRFAPKFSRMFIVGRYLSIW